MKGALSYCTDFLRRLAFLGAHQTGQPIWRARGSGGARRPFRPPSLRPLRLLGLARGCASAWQGREMPPREYLATSRDICHTRPGGAPGISWLEARDALNAPRRRGQPPTTEDCRAPVVTRAEGSNPGLALSCVPSTSRPHLLSPSFPRALLRHPEHTSTHSYANSNSLFAVFAQPILTLQPNTGAIEPGLFSILFEQH